jgi:hypothetical protein
MNDMNDYDWHGIKIHSMATESTKSGIFQILYRNINLHLFVVKKWNQSTNKKCVYFISTLHPLQF